MVIVASMGQLVGDVDAVQLSGSPQRRLEDGATQVGGPFAADCSVKDCAPDSSGS